MNTSPKISVVMSVYNGQKYLKEAIESVLNQTFPDFEFIIFDDCSTDKSLSIIETYTDKRIKLIKNEINKGLTVNLIEGVKIAQGEFLARMDADDICIPQRLEVQLEFLINNPKISILGSAVTFFEDNGQEFIGIQPLTHEEIVVELLFGFTMLHPSVMMRLANLHLNHLNYNPYFKYSQDFDLWVRASKILKFANLNKSLLKMREHSDKISHTLRPEQKAFSEEIRERLFIELNLNISQKEKELIHNIAIDSCLLESDKLKSLEKILAQIIESNNIRQIYKNSVLQKKIHNILILQYYECLSRKKKSGLGIWSSSFKLIKNSDLMLKIKIIIRSIQTLLN